MEIKPNLGLKGASLALTSFVACQHPAESCGHNGLPLTPNSIGILGQAEKLKSFEHPNLCTYLDFRRGKQERVVCVSDFFEDSFKDKEFSDPIQLMEVASQILHGLHYLESHNCIVVNLSSSNILLNTKGKVKLFNYGMGHMTDYGKLVSFPLFDPRTTAPEVLIEGPLTGQSQVLQADQNEETIDSVIRIIPAPTPPYSSSCSVWSLGMIIFAKAMSLKNEYEFWPGLPMSQILRKVISFAHNEDVVSRLVREFSCDSVISNLPVQVLDFLKACLHSDPSQRKSIKELLIMLDRSVPNMYEIKTFPTMNLRCETFSWPPEVDEDIDDENPLDALNLSEIYYLWHLAGGEVMGEIRKNGLMVSLPPVLTHPKVTLNEGHAVGQVKERCTLYDPKVMVLPMSQLKSCLKDLNPEDFFPLLMGSHKNGNSVSDFDDSSSLPLVIKERDVKYQFKRIVLYRRLLQAYPFTRRSIWKEARVDTLPLYRSLIWAALLGIEHDVQAAYEAIDKETPTSTDRQIEVDIPRCHQYNSLLASMEGHRKFKRVLKAWVLTNPQYVYWQGLDSLCAPFLYLNFNDEALAFACLSAFIPK